MGETLNLKLDKHAMNNNATVHLRIYVGGLKEDVTIEDVHKHFSPYGEIDGILVNRVFGFVQFSEESSAQKALANANGSMLMGKKINVHPAQKNRKFTEQKNEGTAQSETQHTKPSDNKPLEDYEAIPEDQYDNHGNFIGDMYQREEEYDEGYNNSKWGEPDTTRQALRGRGAPRARGRGRGAPAAFRERSPIREWPERKFDRFPQPGYARALPVTEKNDCEIIVVSKALTEYAEYVENRLKRLGIVVDLLFPMEDVPIGKVLGNIASRGCLYAILVMPLNEENRSLTLTILHGLPQEHRNMPLEDALQLISRNFQEVQRGGSSGREAVYALMGQLADGRTLTVLQYDKVIEYLKERREQQVKIELGEPLKSTPNTKTQVELQQRILSILNDKKPAVKQDTPPAPTMPVARGEPPNKLLNDPTVRKALDSILQKFV